jgi:hypothetical protein
MVRNSIQFHKDLSLIDVQSLFETEETFIAGLDQARWPCDFISHRIDSHEYGFISRLRPKLHQFRSCGHQVTVIGGTILQATKLTLSVWFLGTST